MIRIMPDYGRLVALLITLAVMAPFLLALSYPSSRKAEREILLKANARFNVPLVVMTFFRMMLTLGFITYILSAIYYMRMGFYVGLAIFTPVRL